MPPNVWTEPFTVRSYEIDPRARLKLPSLCDWLQEAAGNHAGALGVATDQLLEHGRAWVLSRLRIEVARYPRWREKAVVETWPSSENGIVAERDFVVRDGSGAEIARALSHWVVIDVSRRRPVRLPQAVVDITLPERQRALTARRADLTPPDGPSSICTFEVRRSDLDLNRHANNTRYVEWALESVPEDLLETHLCASLEVHFRAESNLGDPIESACSTPVDESDHILLRHRLDRATDHRLLAVLATRWKRR